MELKKIVLEEEAEIIRKGDYGETFANLQEAEIYLKNLINNRDYYIESKFKRKIGEGSYWRSIAVRILALVGVIAGLGYADFNQISLIQGSLLGVGIPCAPIVLYDGLKRFFSKRNAVKEVDSDINALKVKCGYVNEDETVLEEIKTVAKKSEVATTTVDTFIANIRDDVYRITNTRYPGCEQDLKELCTLAEDYLEFKRKLGTTSDSYALAQNSSYFDRLLTIESRITQNEKVKRDQEANMQVIDKIKEELQKERMSLAQIKEPTEKETKNNNPQLTLGGK